jgi:lysozyme family protein
VKTVDEMIDDIIRREGGYVNHPADKGSHTNFGITLKTLSEWRECPVTAADVQRLQKIEAADIYRNEYYEKPHIDKLPAQLQPVVFDMAVNMGPKQAIKILQHVLHRLTGRFVCDGIIGKETARVSENILIAFGLSRVLSEITEERIKYYRNIVKRDPTQIAFLAGWENRAREFLA